MPRSTPCWTPGCTGFRGLLAGHVHGVGSARNSQRALFRCSLIGAMAIRNCRTMSTERVGCGAQAKVAPPLDPGGALRHQEYHGRRGVAGDVERMAVDREAELRRLYNALLADRLPEETFSRDLIMIRGPFCGKLQVDAHRTGHGPDCHRVPRAERKDKRHHGARGAPNFGITLSENRRRLSREPWPNSRT
jgi:hypothetical protein